MTNEKNKDCEFKEASKLFNLYRYLKSYSGPDRYDNWCKEITPRYVLEVYQDGKLLSKRSCNLYRHPDASFCAASSNIEAEMIKSCREAEKKPGFWREKSKVNLKHIIKELARVVPFNINIDRFVSEPKNDDRYYCSGDSTYSRSDFEPVDRGILRFARDYIIKKSSKQT